MTAGEIPTGGPGLGLCIAIIVLGLVIAVVAYVAIEGSRHIDGARQLIDQGRAADQAQRWRDGE